MQILSKHCQTYLEIVRHHDYLPPELPNRSMFHSRAFNVGFAKDGGRGQGRPPVRADPQSKSDMTHALKACRRGGGGGVEIKKVGVQGHRRKQVLSPLSKIMEGGMLTRGGDV